MKRFINAYVVAPLAAALIHVISLTLKLREEGKDIETRLLNDGKPYVLAFWHGRLFYLPHYYQKTAGRFKILVSPSSDGEIIARTLALFGFGIVRGSSFKKAGAALLSLARAVRDGFTPVLIADGSRGPIYNLQAGSLLISKLTGAAALPVTVSFSRFWTLGTWDRLMIPKPFATAVVIYGEPVYASRDCGEEEMERLQAEMELRLKSITERADRYFGDAA